MSRTMETVSQSRTLRSSQPYLSKRHACSFCRSRHPSDCYRFFRIKRAFQVFDVKNIVKLIMKTHLGENYVSAIIEVATLN